MATNTEIANLALSHLGVAREIANLDLEDSNDAATMRRYYDTALDVVLRDFPWPFACKQITLALVTNNPTTEWAFAYQYPTDAIFLRRILSGLRTDNRQSAIAYRIVQGSAGKLIHTDCAEALLEYTVRETDGARYPDDFNMAFSYRLAVYAAVRLTKGDPFNIRQATFQLYLQELARAAANAANEIQEDEDPRSEFQRFRDGVIGPFGRRQDFNEFIGI